MYYLQGDDLPPDWERKRTGTGQVFYVNSIGLSTQWVSEQHSTTRCTRTLFMWLSFLYRMHTSYT